VLIDALPHEGDDPAAYAVRPVTPTRIVAEGDIVTTGDRSFEVLHLPGHTPGEIGLWEAQARTCGAAARPSRSDRPRRPTTASAANG
jgi:glyoxylase-like metal-dependent hydrolase (beta-lactamase superfamily II)